VSTLCFGLCSEFFAIPHQISMVFCLFASNMGWSADSCGTALTFAPPTDNPTDAPVTQPPSQSPVTASATPEPTSPATDNLTDAPVTCDQCSDNNACTKDTCTETGGCLNVAIPGCENGAIMVSDSNASTC